MNFLELWHSILTALASLMAGGAIVLSSLLALLSSTVGTTAPIQIAPQEYPSQTASLPATSTPAVASTTKSSSTHADTPPKKAAVVAAPITPITNKPSLPSIDPNLLNTQTRAALVNILCTSKTNSVHPISASGVFVDNRGVILTNAHVGQFFLLADYPTPDSVTCYIRTGSPAQTMYRATLLYLPPPWVSDNAAQLVAEQAKGTGENDYAFLLVTDAVGSNTLPSTFPALAMTADEPDLNDNTLLVAYPAGFLDGQNIEKYLSVTSAYAIVKELFTYGTGRDIDLISIGGTVVSQGGSSGGAVVRTTDGDLEGIIATATSGDTTAQRDLRAITVAHINRSLAAQGKGGIVQLLTQNLPEAAAEFTLKIAPAEKSLLVNAIEHH